MALVTLPNDLPRRLSSLRTDAIPCPPTSAARRAPLCRAGPQPWGAISKPALTAICPASGTTPVGIAPVRHARTLQTERWLALQRARLLACDHSHVIFTLPHDLNPLWLANVPVMSTLLFQAVRDTLCALLADPKYLGAQPGILAALHTWSQTLVLHPHVHCLVTGGGLTPTGHWVAVRNGFLLPVRVVMAVFRGKMLDAIRQAWVREALTLPESLRPQQFLQSAQSAGPSDQDPVECADDGALSPRRWRGDVSGPLPARRPHQECPAGSLGWGPCHLHVSGEH